MGIDVEEFEKYLTNFHLIISDSSSRNRALKLKQNSEYEIKLFVILTLLTHCIYINIYNNIYKSKEPHSNHVILIHASQDPK